MALLFPLKVTASVCAYGRSLTKIFFFFFFLFFSSFHSGREVARVTYNAPDWRMFPIPLRDLAPYSPRFFRGHSRWWQTRGHGSKPLARSMMGRNLSLLILGTISNSVFTFRNSLRIRRSRDSRPLRVFPLPPFPWMPLRLVFLPGLQSSTVSWRLSGMSLDLAPFFFY